MHAVRTARRALYGGAAARRHLRVYHAALSATTQRQGLAQTRYQVDSGGDTRLVAAWTRSGAGAALRKSWSLDARARCDWRVCAMS
jgi:hypothetical protein